MTNHIGAELGLRRARERVRRDVASPREPFWATAGDANGNVQGPLGTDSIWITLPDGRPYEARNLSGHTWAAGDPVQVAWMEPGPGHNRLMVLWRERPGCVTPARVRGPISLHHYGYGGAADQGFTILQPDDSLVHLGKASGQAAGLIPFAIGIRDGKLYTPYYQGGAAGSGRIAVATIASATWQVLTIPTAGTGSSPGTLQVQLAFKDHAGVFWLEVLSSTFNYYLMTLDTADQFTLIHQIPQTYSYLGDTWTWTANDLMLGTHLNKQLYYVYRRNSSPSDSIVVRAADASVVAYIPPNALDATDRWEVPDRAENRCDRNIIWGWRNKYTLMSSALESPVLTLTPDYQHTRGEQYVWPGDPDITIDFTGFAVSMYEYDGRCYGAMRNSISRSGGTNLNNKNVNLWNAPTFINPTLPSSPSISGEDVYTVGEIVQTGLRGIWGMHERYNPTGFDSTRVEHGGGSGPVYVFSVLFDSPDVEVGFYKLDLATEVVTKIMGRSELSNANAQAFDVVSEYTQRWS